MDFREHWLAHFKEAVEKEIADAGGRDADGYKAVAAKLEKGKDTIYQHYKQKSGKVYPTVEMMVLLEKKYGEGRPTGWASLPPKAVTPHDSPAGLVTHLQPVNPGIRHIAALIAEKCKPLDKFDRETVGSLLRKVAEQPDEAGRAIDTLGTLLGEPPHDTDQQASATG